MILLVIVETKRLILRELREYDKENLANVLSDPISMQYYNHPFNEHEVEEWINWNIENYATFCGIWAAILKDDGTFLGDCGITMQNIDGEILLEIGFHIIKEYCNKGYASLEAAKACMEYAFDVLGFEQIYSYSTKIIYLLKR